MAFNIRQLDRLSYDDVEPLLDEYINGAERLGHPSHLKALSTRTFPSAFCPLPSAIHQRRDRTVNSPKGEAHLKNYPEGVDIKRRMLGDRTLDRIT